MNIKKGNTGSFSRIKKKIWDRKSFGVGGHWPFGRDENTEWARRTDKSRTLNKQKKTGLVYTIDKYWAQCNDKGITYDIIIRRYKVS